MKLILICSILFFCFCSEEKADKNAKAKELYRRICQVVYNNTGNSSSDFTTEWKNIESNVIENKDTLFMIYNNEFQILITKKINIEPSKDTVIIKDTITKSKNSGW
jgi:hypothetical protein